MSGMTDLATWLLEQIAEDERRVRPMAAVFPDERTLTDRGWLERPDVAPFPEALTTSDVMGYMLDMEPARVLAECEAKRKILAAYLPPGGDPHPGQPCVNYKGQRPEDYDEFDTCARHIAASKKLIHSDYVLRLLALPYADRPGYREEWQP